MSISDILQNPNNGLNNGGRDINSTIVDSGLMVGENVWVLTMSADLIASNLFNMKVNGTSVTQVTFNTSNNTTMELIASGMVSDISWIAEAIVVHPSDGTNIRSITIKGKPNAVLAFSNAAVTAGASQATVSFVQSVAINHIPGVTIVDNEALDPLQIYDKNGDETEVYYGYALPGSNVNAPLWRIKKEVVVAGPPKTTKRTWADGNMRFDNIFGTDPTGLTYG